MRLRESYPFPVGENLLRKVIQPANLFPEPYTSPAFPYAPPSRIFHRPRSESWESADPNTSGAKSASPASGTVFFSYHLLLPLFSTWRLRNPCHRILLNWSKYHLRSNNRFQLLIPT